MIALPMPTVFSICVTYSVILILYNYYIIYLSILMKDLSPKLSI